MGIEYGAGGIKKEEREGVREYFPTAFFEWW